jgi:hypothetical protein
MWPYESAQRLDHLRRACYVGKTDPDPAKLPRMETAETFFPGEKCSAATKSGNPGGIPYA